MTFLIRSFLLISALTWAVLSTASAQTPTYQFLKKISLPTGNAKWDYLKMDGERERLFVSHGDRVHVIDLTTEQPIGEITGLKGVHGIALAKDLEKGYISNGTDNAITVFGNYYDYGSGQKSRCHHVRQRHQTHFCLQQR